MHLLSANPAGRRAAECQSPLRALLAVLFILLFSVPSGSVDSADAAEPVFRIDCPNEVRPGQPFSCTVSSRLDFERITLSWLDRTVPLTPGRQGGTSEERILLGTDVKTFSDDSAELSVCGYKGGLSVTAAHRVEVVEASFPVQRLSLPPSKVTLSEEALARHRKEKAGVSRALSLYSAEKRWSLPLLRPVPGEISTIYGVKRILNGQPRSPHRGVDFRTGHGQPIKSCADGIVVLTGEHFFAGKSVYVHHGQGMVSMYFHLSRIKVDEGQTVRRGQPVGLSGKSGRVTGPHLHFGLSLLGQLVDPLPLFQDQN